MKARAALTTEPELALYPVNVDAAQANQTLTLSGKVPSQRLRQQVETILQQTLPSWNLDNNIIAVQVPANPEQVEAEVKQMTAALNQMNGISISTEYNSPKVRLQGTVIQSEEIENVIQAFEKIKGVESVQSQLTLQPFPIATRIYFNLNSAEIIERDFDEKIRLISQYLKKYPQLRVKLIGYKDRREIGPDQNIGLQRSQAVQTALESYGIDRRRIEVNQATGIPPGVTPNQRQWLNRTVMIEIIHDDSNS
jgi:outer membrane protein OmpA-like peptidoglycan-associated protein